MFCESAAECCQLDLMPAQKLLKSAGGGDSGDIMGLVFMETEALPVKPGFLEATGLERQLPSNFSGALHCALLR